MNALKLGMFENILSYRSNRTSFQITCFVREHNLWSKLLVMMVWVGNMESLVVFKKLPHLMSSNQWWHWLFYPPTNCVLPLHHYVFFVWNLCFLNCKCCIFITLSFYLSAKNDLNAKRSTKLLKSMLEILWSHFGF